jgi:hypothetical protein
MLPIATARVKIPGSMNSRYDMPGMSITLPNTNPKSSTNITGMNTMDPSRSSDRTILIELRLATVTPSVTAICTAFITRPPSRVRPSRGR